jgi:hypothetical protein
VRGGSGIGRRWVERGERRIADATRPALLRWEALSGPVQISITFPIVAVLLFVFHAVVFDLSAFRSFFYALFWGIPVTLVIAVATRNEAAKRARARDGDPTPPE